MTTIYVCGPISGYEDANEPAFRAAADYVKELGNVPIVPHDLPPIGHEGLCPPSHGAQTTDDHVAACHLRADLIHLLLYCDSMYVLRGWEASVGARLEVQVAAACGIVIEFESVVKP